MISGEAAVLVPGAEWQRLGSADSIAVKGGLG
jgi:hypothetical protein